MSKIKVCHVSESTSGGVLTHLEQLAQNLDVEKFEQTYVLSALKNNSLLNKKTFYGHSLRLIKMQRNISPLYDFISLIRLIIFFLTNKFDIIHCHSSKAGVIGRLAAFISGHQKVVYTPHAFSINVYNNQFKNWLFSFVELTMSIITDKIICVSFGEYDLATSYYRLAPKHKLVIIPNGIDTNIDNKTIISKEKWLKNNGFNGSEKIICFVGRLSKQKNPKMLIQGYNLLNLPNAILTIIGDGELRTNLEMLVDQLNINKSVLFLGEVSNAREILSLSDVFVNTSLWEGMPYVILEAMSEGVLVIATNILGNRDLIQDNKTGFLIEVNETEELADKINDVLSGADNQEIITNAKRIVQEKYSIGKMIESIEALYYHFLRG